MLLKTVRKSDCRKIMLFTNARDEPKINEWVAHHFLLGFDKIFIFDHLSQEPISKKINNRFGGKLVIKRIDEEMSNIKLDFMKRAVNVAKVNYADWMIYLDADEYININNCTNIKDFLKPFKEADSIGINWLMFGTSNLINQPTSHDDLLIDNFIMSTPRLDKHVKSFVRPDRIVNIVNPHYYVMIDKSRCYNALGFIMPNGPFNIMPLPFFKSPIYIAHYYVQSENEYKRRKGRVMDDGSRPVLPSSQEIHRMYNNVSNYQLKCKYSNNIKKFLQKYKI
jgi:hypothetical protein